MALYYLQHLIYEVRDYTNSSDSESDLSVAISGS